MEEHYIKDVGKITYEYGVNLEEHIRVIEKLQHQLDQQKAIWNKLKEWIEKDHDWNLERGNNDCALGQRWVLDKMQDLEKGEK